jgi:hypothetical protein
MPNRRSAWRDIAFPLIVGVFSLATIMCRPHFVNHPHRRRLRAYRGGYHVRSRPVGLRYVDARLEGSLKADDLRTAFALNGYFPVFPSSGLLSVTFLRTADGESFE